jgi:hypothetical protein
LEAFHAAFETQMGEFVTQCSRFSPGGLDESAVKRQAGSRLRASVDFLGQDAFRRMKQTRPGRRFLEAAGADTLELSLSTEAGLRLFYSTLVAESVFHAIDIQPARELFLTRLQEALEDTGLEEPLAYGMAQLVRILTEGPSSPRQALSGPAALRAFMERPEVLQYLGCHWHRDVFWFIKERMQSLLYWMFTSSVLESGLSSNTRAWGYRKSLLAWAKVATRALEQAERAGYDFNRFLDLLSGGPELFEKTAKAPDNP